MESSSFGLGTMKRRDFLKTGCIACAGGLTGHTFEKYFGYIPGKSNLPTFQETFPDVPDGKGEVVLLHPYLERVLSVPSLPAHKQDGPDCVSQATSMATDVMAAIQVCLRQQRWNGKLATEWIHFGGRCVMGKQRGINGGARIIEACNFIKEYGVLFRKKYRNINFTHYNFQNSNFRNLNNYPNLVDQAKKHKTGTITQVKNWEDARAALRNLAPVVLGGMLGFENRTRDKDGFLRPRGEWSHAWMLLGFDDRYQRKGALVMNSFGDNFFYGPRRHNQPKGSMWVDVEVLNSMIIEAYALSDYVGTKKRKLY